MGNKANKRKTRGDKKKGNDSPDSSDKDDRIAQLEEENKKLRENSAKAGGKSHVLTKKARESEAKSEVLNAIHEWIKQEAWRTIKFITSERQETSFAQKYYDSLAGDDGTVPPDIGPFPEFLSIYGPYFTTLLNGHRSYVLSKMKMTTYKFMDEHNGKVPPEAIIKKIVLRQLDPAKMTEPEWKIAIWYWDELLPAAGRSKFIWQEHTRYYATISEAQCENCPNKLEIPPSTEAILLTFYENCLPRWVNLYKFKQKYPGMHANIRRK